MAGQNKRDNVALSIVTLICTFDSYFLGSFNSRPLLGTEYLRSNHGRHLFTCIEKVAHAEWRGLMLFALIISFPFFFTFLALLCKIVSWCSSLYMYVFLGLVLLSLEHICFS